jgi:hypothetical protein
MPWMKGFVVIRSNPRQAVAMTLLKHALRHTEPPRRDQDAVNRQSARTPRSHQNQE